ncbi:putative carbon-carbon lyase [Escherichia coli]|uniref:Putative carbon-carbon lyase n=1 Tax=Escherichia coli TaxID=562 RepID=A0A447XUL8_ECOLX|nr:putative carbon-carbon lyase [Escherichia coli]
MNALLTNPFKERLRKGEVQIGLWLSSTTSYMAEIAATSGYDWLLIDGSTRQTPFRIFITSYRR